MTNRDKPGIAFEASLFDVFRTASRITISDPGFALRALRLMRRQQKAAKVRDLWGQLGTHVPPFVIYSSTSRCNLQCAGCYANILHVADRDELTSDRTATLMQEARDLGISVMLLAGGEPLLRQHILDHTAATPEILYLLFTNGSLLDESVATRLKRQRHVVPVLSIEGDESKTDARRGSGAHQQVIDAMNLLRGKRVFFGTSTTLTRENFELATDEAHLRDLIRSGCRLFYFINYVPVESDTDHLQLSMDQVKELEARLAYYRKRLPCLFIAFPHDEMALGGCLAAGRGFLHINAFGDVEPCPFSPYSDRNLTEVSLQEALHSPLLLSIRESDVKLDETDGRCALWKRKDWVQGLADASPRKEKT